MLPKIVTPGQAVDISISLTAPELPGVYKSIWSFEDTTGKRFGLGAASTGEIWVQVKVIAGPTSTSTPVPEPTQTSTPTLAPPFISTAEILAYDFINEVCSAQWQSNNVTKPCPGSVSEAQNTLTLVTMPTLEDGKTSRYPAIRVKPGAANGTVAGIYPEYLVQPGDHFRAIASCEADAAMCSVLFRVSYQDANGTSTDLWAVGEFYDQKYTEINIDLTALAGQKVKFILNITSLNSDPGNSALWVSPGIYRKPVPTETATLTATATSPSTPTPTITLTPVPPTATPTPQPAQKEPPSTLEALRKFFDDLFKQLFGG
jgi:hypothetical protein